MPEQTKNSNQIKIKVFKICLTYQLSSNNQKFNFFMTHWFKVLRIIIALKLWLTCLINLAFIFVWLMELACREVNSVIWLICWLRGLFFNLKTAKLLLVMKRHLNGLFVIDGRHLDLEPELILFDKNRISLGVLYELYA